jgi:hypothetical protein
LGKEIANLAIVAGDHLDETASDGFIESLFDQTLAAGS